MIQQHSQYIKTQAQQLGFLACGISQAQFLESEATKLEQWLAKGHHGQMTYMENHFDLRLDPRKLVPGAKSVISLLYNYYPQNNPTENNTYKIAKYAYGNDYHYVIKDKLKILLQQIQQNIGNINGRAFVDSAPVLDKAWAAKSGLGWIGKNTNLITKQVGSYYFIAELIVDIPLAYDLPTTDHCGTCTACIDACPTQALLQPYVLDAQKCISYLTIELKESIPNQFQGKLDEWIFGCDVCQDVCPWNRFSKPTTEPQFTINPTLQHYTKKDWEEITEDVFKTIFDKSPLKRTSYNGILKNIKAQSNNSISHNK